MDKTIVLLLASLSSMSMGFAQKKVYNLPSSIQQERFELLFQKVSGSTSSYFINYKAKNIGDGVLVIDRSQTSLEQNNGEIRALSEVYVLKAGDDKTVYNQFRVKPPIQASADYLKLGLGGISYAAPSEPLKVDEFAVAEKAIKNVGPFSLKIMEHNVYSDRIYVNVKCSFNGKSNTLGQVDLSGLTVKGGQAEVVKKGDIIFPGKSYSFSINIKPNGEQVSLLFDKVLSVMAMNKIDIDPVVIKSTTYVEPAEEAEKTEEEEKEKKDSTPAELSYSDVVALKKDIALEVDSGGKPIELANEFLMEKGHISTAQVIDVMSVFNLDGARLKFAKMAFPYTSDKPKYHMVVASLSYTKNKQALEEFLEVQ